jgi:hypothetical protein
MNREAGKSVASDTAGQANGSNTIETNTQLHECAKPAAE